MTSPRGVILIVVMLALCVLTLVVLPALDVVPSEKTVRQTSAVALDWQLGKCRQQIVRALRLAADQSKQAAPEPEALLTKHPLTKHPLTKHPLPKVGCALQSRALAGSGVARVIELRAEGKDGTKRASALWILEHEGELLFHHQPLAD